MQERKVTHRGIVCIAEKDHIRVVIETLSACATCHGKAMCSADKADKMIDAWPDGDIKVGDEVVIEMDPSLGRIAVFWMFIMPSLVFVCSIFVLFYLTGKDVLSAVLSVGIAFGYYGFISLFRNRISRKFSFRAYKVNESNTNNNEMR